MNKVLLQRYEEINDDDVIKMIDNAFSEFSLDNVNEVIIKPNMMYYWDPSTGETTDPKIVSLIIDKLRNMYGKDVIINVVEADASAMRTKFVFKFLGYDKLCQEKDVNLINLSKIGENVINKVKIKEKEIKIRVNTIFERADVVINVPKLKVHRSPPIVSCALKNLFGAISTPYKYQYHPRLDEYVTAINKVIRSDLIIVDGLVVHGKYPKKMGLIISANDPVSCDIVATRIAGLNPRNDPLIQAMIKEQKTKNDFELIDYNDAYQTSKRDFPKNNLFIQNLLWETQLFLLNTYAKISGDILPPVLKDI